MIRFRDKPKNKAVNANAPSKDTAPNVDSKPEAAGPNAEAIIASSSTEDTTGKDDKK